MALAAEVFTEWAGLERVERTAKKRQITKKAVKAGAKLVQQAAKARAPRRKGSGALRRSLGIKAEKGRGGKTLAYAVVGARRKVATRYKGRATVPANYAHLVERGTRPHAIPVGAGGAARRHPGAKPKPFLRPALQGQRAAAYAIMLKTMAAEVAKVLAGRAAGAGG